MRNTFGRLTTILLSLITLLGFALRIYHLGDPAIWGDEAFSIALALKPIGASLAVGADLHPPLYHVLLHFWLNLAGHTEFAARYLSLMAGVLLIPATYVVGKRLTGETAGLIAAALAAVSPFGVYYSQEARMYALSAFVCTLSVYFAARIWDEAKVSGFGSRSFILYLVFTLAAMYSHFFAFFVIAAQDVFVLWLWRKRPDLLIRWIGGQVLLAVLFLPWLIPQVGFFAGRAQSNAAALSLGGLIDVFGGTLNVFMLGQQAPSNLICSQIIALLMGITGVAASLRRDAKPIGRFVPVYLLLPLFLAWLIGPLLNYFNPRFLLVALPAWLILLAAGVVWLLRAERFAEEPVRRSLAGTALGLIMGAMLVALFGLYSDPAQARSGYREMMAEIHAQSKPGDALFLLNPEQGALFDYYGDKSLPSLTFPLPGDLSDAKNQAQLEKVTRDDKRIWLVMFGNARDWDSGGSLQTWLNDHAFRASRSALIDTEIELYVIGQLEPSPAEPVDFGGLITLTGYAVSAESVAPGDTLQVALAWESRAKMDKDYTIFVHLLDSAGKVAGQFDGQPAGGAHPTSAWQPGEKNVDRFGILVDATTPPGTYQLEIGWYEWPSLERIPVLGPDGKPTTDHTILVDIEVR